MTLIIAAQGKDFVVVGADSRETIDAESVRVEINIGDKLIELSKHAVVLTAGDSGLAQYAIERYKKTRRIRDVGVTAVTENFAGFCRHEAIEQTAPPSSSSFSPNFAFVIGGLDKGRSGKFTIPKCYRMSSRQGFRLRYEKEGFAIDGKPMLAYYKFAKHYKKNEMTLKDLTNLVAQTLWDTSRVDGDVGGKFKMGYIQSDKFHEMDETDITKAILNKW